MIPLQWPFHHQGFPHPLVRWNSDQVSSPKGDSNWQSESNCRWKNIKGMKGFYIKRVPTTHLQQIYVYIWLAGLNVQNQRCVQYFHHELWWILISNLFKCCCETTAKYQIKKNVQQTVNNWQSDNRAVTLAEMRQMTCLTCKTHFSTEK